MSFAHTNFPWRVVNAKTCIEYNQKSKGGVHIAIHWKVDSIFWNNNADSKDLINRLNVDIALFRQWPNWVTVFQKSSENKGALFCSAVLLCCLAHLFINFESTYSSFSNVEDLCVDSNYTHYGKLHKVCQTACITLFRVGSHVFIWKSNKTCFHSSRNKYPKIHQTSDLHPDVVNAF